MMVEMMPKQVSKNSRFVLLLPTTSSLIALYWWWPLLGLYLLLLLVSPSVGVGIAGPAAASGTPPDNSIITTIRLLDHDRMKTVWKRPSTSSAFHSGGGDNDAFAHQYNSYNASSGSESSQGSPANSSATNTSVAIATTTPFTGVKLVVRIGHIGAKGALPNDDKILNISRTQLLEEGILGPDLDFEINSQMGCGDSYEGVAVAAQMYHKEGVRAFIGPYCNAELEAVAKMGSFWNIPVISYMPTTTALVDRNIYKTLARLSSKNTNSIAKAVVKLVEHYKWRRIAIVTNTGSIAYERVLAFEEEFRRSNILVAKKVMFEESWDAAEMLRSGLLQELQQNARIIICIFSLTRELTREFMQAIFKSQINNAEYAYILPWLQSGLKDSSPWVGASGEMLQQVKDHYANAVIVDDVNGFDDSIIKGLLERMSKVGLRSEDIDMSNIYGYLHLYDSLKLYGLAARKALDASEKGATLGQVTNGHLIWTNMRRLAFDGGATGRVLMDDLADRAPLFAAFYISPNRDKPMKMVHMESYRLPNCDGLVNRSGCFDLKLTDTMTGFWPSENGSMPLDEPVCGFRGQRCSYLMEIAIGVTATAVVLSFLAVFFLYRYCQTRALNKMPWRVNYDDLRMIDEDQLKSILSLGSANTKLSGGLSSSLAAKKHAILGVNTHATYHKYPQRRPIKFIREDLQLLSQIKAAIHDNLNPFLGVVFNEKEDMLVLWKFCSRGTIQDIIYNKNMVLDEKFHSAFIRDITLGLEYLHMSPIGCHGSLTPWSCAIDRNWSVRLTDFGIYNALERWEKEGCITIGNLSTDDDKSQAAQRTSIIYLAPEFLKNRDVNRRRRMDQKWTAQTATRKQAGDIYSFGMVMYEILFRTLPFPQGTDILAVVDASADGSRHIKPQIQDQMRVHPDLAALLIDCWSANPEIRPSIRRVRLNTEMVLKCKGTLVDQMMRVMEQYANNLEKLVKERTGMLEEANLRADHLLNQLLPPYVANELKQGRSVPPKLFSSATVLFSDVVGFTTICSTSSPLEVVNLLNGIYTGFDERIREHKCYKVETIGDAYMVVSGIPEENGKEHVRNISNVALLMRQFLVNFEVPHRRSERIKCRWGFHSGPVAAGVVGMTAPRYCLFGDTVNTASRMESTGLPELIQISQSSYDLLMTTYPEFMCQARGEVEVKGKGTVVTYWLERRAATATCQGLGGGEQEPQQLQAPLQQQQQTFQPHKSQQSLQDGNSGHKSAHSQQSATNQQQSVNYQQYQQASAMRSQPMHPFMQQMDPQIAGTAAGISQQQQQQQKSPQEGRGGSVGGSHHHSTTTFNSMH